MQSSVRLLKKIGKEIKVFYHGERRCSLFQQSHQTSFCKILSRTDTFFVWWYNIIRNCWLFQNIRRYVLRRYNIDEIFLLNVNNNQNSQFFESQMVFSQILKFLKRQLSQVFCLISFWTSMILQQDNSYLKCNTPYREVFSVFQHAEIFSHQGCGVDQALGWLGVVAPLRVLSSHVLQPCQAQVRGVLIALRNPEWKENLCDYYLITSA